MARRPRLDFPGARHHVMNRAARPQVFNQRSASDLVLEVLSEVPQRFGAGVHGFSLLPDRYHLLVDVPRGNLSEVMRFVGAQITQRFNKLTSQDGALFRGRFRNRVVLDEDYWQHVLAWLHLAPVREGVVEHPADTDLTSYCSYLEPEQAPEWLTTHELLARFGSPEAHAEYVESLKDDRLQPPETFNPRALWARPKAMFVPEGAQLQLRSADEALDEVARVLDVPREKLLERTNRGPSSSYAPWVAAWWLHRATDLTQAAIGELLGVSRTRVSQLIDQANSRFRDDEEVRKVMAELDDRL